MDPIEWTLKKGALYRVYFCILTYIEKYKYG